jgi:glycosyltransferase involved in cell wall biosynthesis
MRVAIEATSAAPGGGLSLLRGAIPALEQAWPDAEIDVIVQRDVGRERFGERSRTLAVGPFRSLAHRFAWVHAAFPRLVSRHHAVFAPGNVAPLGCAAKTVLFVQNAHVVPQRLWLAEHRRPKRCLQRAVAHLSIRRASRVLFVSDALKKWAQPYWAARHDEPIVAHPGVTLAPSVASASRGRDVLVVSNLVAHKRVDEAVRAFAVLVRAYQWRGRLVIAGGESMPGGRIALTRLAGREGVGERVEFLGFLAHERLARAYAEAACYLSTSALEAFPLPPLEAMAAGLPVVIPDTPPFREVCGEEGSYFPFPSGDPAAVASILATTLNSRIAPTRLADAARRRAAHFSWGRFGAIVADALAAAAGLPPERSSVSA